MIDPRDFAGFVFTGVIAVSALTLVGAVSRRILRGDFLRRGRFGPHAAGAAPGAGDSGEASALGHLPGDVDALRDAVTELRRELDEVQNRLDFTERLLAQARATGRLPAPKAG